MGAAGFLHPTTLSVGILNKVKSSILTEAVQPQVIMDILGFSALIESLTRVITTTQGCVMPESNTLWASWYF